MNKRRGSHSAVDARRRYPREVVVAEHGKGKNWWMTRSMPVPLLGTPAGENRNISDPAVQLTLRMLER